MTHTLGIIGGSGLYEMEGLASVRENVVDTPYGSPSDAVIEGTLGSTRLLFLPRHGRGHRFAPHEINFRANIAALKILGATHVLSISAVGSMKEHIRPGELVAADQFIDLTRRRVSTFFEQGIVGHVPFADPTCDGLRAAAAQAVRDAGGVAHRAGTYVCIDGPQFSTRGESSVYRSWGVDCIGMTAMPEAKLAREAELPYAVLALVTDYDCWHQAEEDVSVAAVLEVVRKNVALAKRTIARLCATLPDPKLSRAFGASQGAIMTAEPSVTSAARERLAWLLNRS